MGKICENGCITEHVAPVSGGIETAQVWKLENTDVSTIALELPPYGKCQRCARLWCAKEFKDS